MIKGLVHQEGVNVYVPKNSIKLYEAKTNRIAKKERDESTIIAADFHTPLWIWTALAGQRPGKT